MKTQDLSQMNIALVADWLTNKAGAEKVFLTLAEMFPDADIYTSVFEQSEFPELKDREVRTSFLQSYPFSHKHQFFPHLRPRAFEQFDLSEYDIVISSSSAESKGVITQPDTFHICYCHSPTRYYWSHYHEYLSRNQYGLLDPIFKMVMPRMVHGLRMWDRLAADRVDQFVTNSEFIKQRVKKYYDQEAQVVNPPVDVERFKASTGPADFFLVVGRLVSYKKPGLAVKAFNELGLPLKVAGYGPQQTELEGKANENVEILGRVSDEEITRLMSQAQALIFPQEEDFGIVAVEAQAAGTPVIAFNKGGARETVIENETGLFFDEQTVESLMKAIKRFQEQDFDPEKIDEHASQFARERFKDEMYRVVEKTHGDYLQEMNLIHEK